MIKLTKTALVLLVFIYSFSSSFGQALDASISFKVDVLCNGDSTGAAQSQVTGGTIPYFYLWDDPYAQTTSYATGLPAGTWTLTVTDGLNNTDTAVVVINEPPALTITTTSTDETGCGLCDGTATANVSGGTSPYDYSWDDPMNQTEPTATGLCPGTYTVTVTDANFCTDTASATVNGFSSSFLVTTSSTATSGCLTCDGTATANASGGTTPYTYLWDDPSSQTSQSATGLCSGTYNVTVSDNNSCTATSSVTVSTASVTITLSTSSTDASGCGTCDGTASVSANGGTTPYDYLWNDPSNQTASTATGLCSGVYTVTVSDANGCSETANVTVNDAGGSGLSLSTSSVDVSGCTACDGSATVSVSGGTTPYGYQWNDPMNQTTPTANNLCEGTYTVTVTDLNGCSGTANATVGNSGGSGLTLSISTTDASCGQNNGTASVSVSGGTMPYSYLWNDPNSQTTANAINLAEGTYTVTVTDANGCSDTANAVINMVGGPTAFVSVTDVTCNGADDGTATALATGGTLPYSYLWDDPDNQTSQTATGLSPGSYTVTVTDDNGCYDIASGTITEPTALSATASGTDPTCPGGCDGEATANASGGISPYLFEWDDPSSQTDQTATGLCAGTYTVTVTDDNGCTETASVAINDPAGMSLSTSVTQSTCGNSDGSATVSVSGGNTPYDYLWSDANSQTTATATGLAAGGYSVTVTDDIGCTKTATVNVSDVGAPSISISSKNDVTCNGDSDGSATVSASGGVTPYSYAWSDPLSQTTATATGLSGDIYTVTVTDDVGCKATENVTITEPGALLLSLDSKTDASCNGACDGEAEVSASGGTNPYNYTWSDGQIGTKASNLCPGAYTVTVTDDNSCTEALSVTITEPSPLTLTMSGNDPTCPGGCDGDATANVSGGSAPYQYEWNDPASQNTQTATGLCDGMYTITVTDDNGCIGSSSIILSDPAGMSLSISTIDATCGNSDGSATVSVTGGSMPYSYLWNDPASQTNATAVSLTAGTYTVTVTDDNGCTATANAIVNNIGGPSASISSTTDVTCNGGNDGSATVSASGGTTPYDYLWNDPNNQTSQTATGLEAGSYTATVTDANGCQAFATATVDEPAALDASVTSGTNVSCNGLCDGEATASATGGVTPYSFSWSNGQNGTNATNLCAGAYTVTVTDANNCTDTDNVMITEPAAITINLSANNPTCPGSCDGSATANVSGGTGPYDYLWNDPLFQNTQTAAGLCAGSYTVTVTDDNGCTSTGSVTLNNPPGMTLSVSTVDATCGDADGSATVSASGGNTPYSYQWDDPALQTTPTATGLAAGGYNVTVTDDNGCTATATANVNNISGPSATISSSTDVSCNGGNDGSATVSASGGTTPYSYQWNDPLAQTTATATGLSAGSYTVDVTDDNGCVGSASVNISEPTTLNASITSKTNVSCNGGSDGSATVSASGGTTPYSYQWNDPNLQTTPQANNLPAGNYTVTVTDDNGCTETESVVITEPAALSLSVSGVDPSCPGSCDGEATANVSGGTFPYTYQWNDPANQNTQTAIGLCDGTYTVTITDDKGCTTSASIILNDPAGMSLNFSKTDATCGNADGSATVSVTGGSTPYDYLWNDPASQTTATATGLAAGAYTVTVADGNGCTKKGSVNVNNINGPSASISSSTDVSCNGGNDGSATASATGGTTPYDYQWDDLANQTTATATGLSAGTYNVIITDDNGCAASASVTITEPAALNASIASKTDVSCHGACDGTATASASGGTSPYSYLWSDGQTGAIADNLCPGNYTVTVTDANGCTSTDITGINEPAALTVTATGTDPSCPGGCDGSATANVSGGVGPYTYQWDDPAFQNSQTAVNLCAGTYTVVVTDANGCNTNASITLNNPAGMSLFVSTTNATCGNADGSATVSVTGGNTPYNYLWSDGQTNAIATGLAAGAYTVTVTDDNGCSKSTTANVNNTGGPTASISSSTDVSCNGGSDGSATASATGGTSPYSYQWDDSDNQTTETATGLSAGIYSVIVSDNNGCAASASVTITEPSALNTAVSKSNVSCNGGSDGSITVSVSGGTNPYTYLWNDPASQTSATAGGLSAGTYTVTVTDDNGCTTTKTATVSQPAALSLTVSADNPGCPGSCDGSASASVSGGTIPYSYQWNDPSFQQNATAVGLCAGTYWVTVTDENGCTITGSVTLNDPAGMSLSTTTTDASCGIADGSATVSASGGASPYSYLWDDGQNTATATGLAAGAYTVTVTDNNGCTASATANVNNTGAPSVSISSSTDVSCFGENDGSATVSATGGATPYTYQWDDPAGQTTPTATGLSAGIYSVIVTDGNGCAASASVTIDEPTQLGASITSSADVSCNGACDGFAKVTVNGGTTPYGYLWSDPAGQTNATATGLCKGSFNVTVTDANGCSTIKSVNISQPSAISLTMSVNDATCGMSDGSATVNAAGGTPSYGYNWSSGGNMATENGLSAGTYTVTVNDANGCTASETATVNNSNGPVASISASHVNCNGGNDGEAEVSVTGGVTPYSYLWSDNQTSSIAKGLVAGSYSVTVTDSTGCEGFASITITEPAPLQSSASSTDVTCGNDNTGSASITVTGGVTPYSYTWSDLTNIAGSSATGLTAGTYNVTVTDDNGCTLTNSVTINSLSNISVSFSTIDARCGSANGEATAMADGGIAPYSYQWDDPAGQVTATATGLAEGDYQVVVTDSIGCQLSADTLITNTTLAELSLDVTDESCEGNADGSIVAEITGEGNFTLAWSTGASGDSISSLTAGEYAVTVTDKNGCPVSDTAEVAVSGVDCGGFEIPSAFSPNGDGTNDRWEIPGIEDFGEVMVNIYNRWGSLIFSSNGYQDAWDGTNKGKKLPSAVYYYVVKTDNEVHNGTVTIVR